MDHKELLNLSVLFVDDDESIVMLTAHRLKKIFGKVYTAKNGKEGLALFLKNHPTVVITDINMPVMNGIDFIKEIKSLKPNQLVLAITAYNTEEYTQILNSLNVPFLIKPANKGELESAIDGLFNNVIKEAA